jgi:hypothetical protein
MLTEPTLADATLVRNGRLYVADGVVKVSTIGTSIDGTAGSPATVADLKTLWGAAAITTCDYASRIGGVFIGLLPGVPSLDIFET